MQTSRRRRHQSMGELIPIDNDEVLLVTIEVHFARMNPFFPVLQFD